MISLPCFDDRGKAASPMILERSVRQLCLLELAQGEEEKEDNTQIDSVIPPREEIIADTEDSLEKEEE